MHIASFDDLQAAIQEWYDRDDIVTPLPRFIALAEERLNRTLRVAAMETIVKTQTADSTGYVPLPDDYQEMRSLSVRLPDPYPLRFVTPGEIADYPAISGFPAVFAQVNRYIRLAPIPPTGTPLEMGYYQRIPPLSQDNPCNWLLATAPGVYLYGALVEMAGFLRDDPTMWEAKYQQAVESIKSADRHARWNAGPLAMRSGISLPRRGRR